MKIKAWITTLTGASLLALVAGPASASEYAYAQHRAVYDYARVVSVTPVVRHVTVRTPVRECWEDVEYHTVDDRPGKVVGGTLFGAIVGGVIGHQFGSGSGNDAATVAGSLIGAAMGNSAAKRHAAYEPVTYSRPVRRCETNYRSRTEERIDGYDVIYKYHGRKYATRTPYDPGNRIRIRVDVRPAA